MVAILLTRDTYSALATSVLVVHALFILWVIFGAFLTRSRPKLRWLHFASLVWGMLTELLLWPCPLTWLEDWLESKAGIEPYQGGFLLHYLDKVIYPDISATTLTITAVTICGVNLIIYFQQMWALVVREHPRQ
jgi:Protein of Unknown function (DUF2784)